MSVPIYAAALGAFLVLLQVFLMILVGSRRVKGPAIGTGDDKDMERRMRRHGNLAENSGLFLAVIALLELLVGQTAYVAAICILFVVARVAHALAFTSLAGSHGEDLTGGRKLFGMLRFVGAFGTLLTAMGASGGIIAALA